MNNIWLLFNVTTLKYVDKNCFNSSGIHIKAKTHLHNVYFTKMFCKTIRKIDCFQYNTIVPISKSTKSVVWSVIDGDENSFFAPFYIIHFPREDDCSRYIIFHLPKFNFNLRKIRHCVRFAFFMLDVFWGGGAQPNCPNAGSTCKNH